MAVPTRFKLAPFTVTRWHPIIRLRDRKLVAWVGIEPTDVQLMRLTRRLFSILASNCYTLCSTNRLLGNLLDTKYYTTRTITFVVLLCKTGAR